MQKIKIYLNLLKVLLLLSIGLLTWFINSSSPNNQTNIFLFYLLTSVFAFSAATLIGFYLRKLFGQRELLNIYALTASREGLWLTIILLSSLYLAHRGWFTWLNASFLVLAFIFFEFYLLTKNND